jgi:hypothetical protein
MTGKVNLFVYCAVLHHCEWGSVLIFQRSPYDLPLSSRCFTKLDKFLIRQLRRSVDCGGTFSEVSAPGVERRGQKAESLNVLMLMVYIYSCSEDFEYLVVAEISVE